MYIETEAKFEVKPNELEEIRARFLQMGAVPVLGPDTEENQLFDFPDRRLAHAGCALRLRSYAGRTEVTFKGPVQSDPLLKKREEIETLAESADALKRIFERLGLVVCFGYSKTREIMQYQEGSDRYQICPDQTPVGSFVEIEGSAEGIKQLAAAFGWSEFIKKSYVDLYQERLP